MHPCCRYSLLFTSKNMTTQTKILIVGDGGVGKTCAIERKLNGYFEKKYIPGSTVTVYNVGGNMVYDFPGQYRYNFTDLTDGIREIDSAVVMFDLTSELSRRSVPMWKRSIVDQFGDVPVKVIGTKADLVERTADYKISAKKEFNLELVF